MFRAASEVHFGVHLTCIAWCRHVYVEMHPVITHRCSQNTHFACENAQKCRVCNAVHCLTSLGVDSVVTVHKND